MGRCRAYVKSVRARNPVVPRTTANAWQDRAPRMLTKWVLSLKYDLNQARARLQRTKRFANLSISIVWSTVSKAAERSNKKKIRVLFLSTSRTISLKTLTKAVSVLWNCLYADCSISSSPLLEMWLINWDSTTFSISLDMSIRLEIGRKFERASTSSAGFLRRGFKIASLKQSGNTAKFKEWFTIWVITGKSTDVHCFKTEAGTGSRGQDLLVILLSTCNSETSDNVTDIKHDKVHWWTMASDSTTISDVESSEFRRTVIFSPKKSMNLLARSPSDALPEGYSAGTPLWRSLFTVLKRVRGLLLLSCIMPE